MERIAGIVLSGLAVRIAGAALALYIGAEAAAYVADVYGQAETALAAVR